MNFPVSVKQVVLVRHPVDFRKGFNGLLGECYRLGFDPYKGDCVVFIKNDRSQVRSMLGDEFGLYLMNRRFEKGRLTVKLQPKKEEHPIASSIAELGLIFEGATFTIHKRLKPWRG